MATSDNNHALNLLRGLTEPGAPRIKLESELLDLGARRYRLPRHLAALKDYLMAKGRR